MNTKNRLFVLVVFLGIFISESAFSNSLTRDPSKYFFDQFLGDLTEEIDIAKELDKKFILIMFESEECPFCKRMKKTVLNQVNVQEYFRSNFHILLVDIDGDVEITDFKGDATTMKDFSFDQLRVRATPVFAFFDLEGRVIKRGRYTGATTGVEEFMQYGQFMTNDIYKKMSFTRYKRSLK